MLVSIRNAADQKIQIWVSIRNTDQACHSEIQLGLVLNLFSLQIKIHS